MELFNCILETKFPFWVSHCWIGSYFSGNVNVHSYYDKYVYQSFKKYMHVKPFQNC